MFEVAEAYEVMMGRWSRQLAPLFVEFVGVWDGEKMLDVGCGTGSLSATLGSVTGASKICWHRSFRWFYRIRPQTAQLCSERQIRRLCRA